MCTIRLAVPLLLAVLVFRGTAAGEEGPVVPDVVGLAVEDAAEMLTDAGFEVAYTVDPEAPEDSVAGQDPGGLAIRALGSLVTLRVGRKPVEKPKEPASL